MKLINYSLKAVGISLLLTVTLFLGACSGGSSLTLNQDNINKIQNDMSPNEVQSILGKPSESTTEPIPIVGGTQTTYVYENNTSRATIVFKNDKVTEKRSNFGTPAP